MARKFHRAVDPRTFLRKAAHKTLLTPEQLVKLLEDIESRAVIVDARKQKRGDTQDLLPLHLTKMQHRAIADAKRLGLIRLGMLKPKGKPSRKAAA